MFKIYGRYLLALGLASLCWGSPARADVLGDVNGDQQVTVTDAIQLLRFIAQIDFPSDAQLVLGDVFPNPGEGDRRIGDRRINVQDVIQLLQYTVGLITPDQFGATQQFLYLSPKRTVAGPFDQIQFTAIPINFTGTVAWILTSTNVASPGSLSTSGLYLAPDTIPNDSSASVTIHARIGQTEETAIVDLANSGPPPPPPVRTVPADLQP